MTNSAHEPGDRRVCIEAVEEHVGVTGEQIILGGDPLRLFQLRGRTREVVALLRSGATISDTAARTKTSIHSIERLADRLLKSGLAQPVVGPADHDWTSAAVTVVIPIKDTASRLDAVLRSVRSSGFDGSVVVVDDGSAQDLAPTAALHNATVLRHVRSLGPAAARNRGASAATTDLIAFIDADCIASPTWLAATVGHFADDAVAVVAPRIVAKTLPDQHANSLYAYEQVRSSLDLGQRPGLVRPKGRIAYVPAAALLVRRASFNEVGGFDETLHVGEDVDLLWRIVARGHTVRYEPGATVAHEHRVRWRAFAQRRAQYGTSAAELTTRHEGQVPPIVLSPWSLAVWAGLSFQSPLGLLSALCTFLYSTAKLPAKLSPLRHPGPLAVRLASRGHTGAYRQLASATWRTYLPVALLASARSARARRWTVAAAVVHNALDYHERKPTLNPLRYLAIRLLDDTAYCFGVWQGCFRKRTIDPLVPQFVNWPGKRSVTEDPTEES